MAGKCSVRIIFSVKARIPDEQSDKMPLCGASRSVRSFRGAMETAYLEITWQGELMTKDLFLSLGFKVTLKCFGVQCHGE